MKVSVYCTVFNEESSIRPLLDSLLMQTKKPDEIIIVDGGSADNTVEIIEEYVKKSELIRLIIAKGSNVARGRNIGIKNTKYDIVASTDAGCTVDKYWLENLMKNFDSESDIVTGICIPDAKNIFEECFAELLYPHKDDWKADWPSHQNIAFKKSVWGEIRYQEKCYRSEDTLFNLKAREKDFKFRLARDAIVYWRPRKNLWEVFKNIYLWNKSNIENDVRVKEYTEVALGFMQILIWRLLSIFILSIVFIFVSKTAAILLSPFVLKNTINFYRNKKVFVTEIICLNLIAYTDMLATIFGFVAGKLAIRSKK